jgi:lipopolysaccharide export system permease protein
VKKLDIYIIRKFLGTFFFVILLIIAIAIVIDITEKIDDFIEEKLSVGFIITEYYIYFIPWIGLILAPLFVFISVVFFTSRMSNNSEIVASLSGGVNFYRLLVPYILSASFLMIIFLHFNHRIVPHSNLKRVIFEDNYVKRIDKSRDRNFHLQIAPDTFIYLQNYNYSIATGYKFSMEGIRDKEPYYKMTADKIVWNGDSLAWEMTRILERKRIGWREEITEYKKENRDLGFSPDVLEEKVMFKETMTSPELREYIKAEELRGGLTLDFFYVELYRRTAYPVGTLILTIIAVAMTSRKSRGGLGPHIVAGMGLGVTYMAVQQFASTFATKGDLHPLLASWIPNIIYAAISIYLIIRAPK